MVASSRSSGVDALTGDGLADALAGADALVDVTNSPSLEGTPALDFFTKSATNIADAAKGAGVGHYVALSIVGVDGLPESGTSARRWPRRRSSPSPAFPTRSVHATQFVEFAGAITESMTVGDEARVPDALIQPVPPTRSPPRSRERRSARRSTAS